MGVWFPRVMFILIVIRVKKEESVLPLLSESLNVLPCKRNKLFECLTGECKLP